MINNKHRYLNAKSCDVRPYINTLAIRESPHETLCRDTRVYHIRRDRTNGQYALSTELAQRERCDQEQEQQQKQNVRINKAVPNGPATRCWVERTNDRRGKSGYHINQAHFVCVYAG